MAFIGYYKGDYELHALERRDPIITAASSDFGAPGRIIDFQAPLSHTLLTDKISKKGKFEKMFLDGRPPVNVGVTSGGDIFGGTAVTFSDVLGDQQFSMFAASISQYRTLSFSYLNLARRLNYALQGFSQTQFFYGQLAGVFYDPVYSGFIDRDLATATTTGPRRHRVRHLAVQPLPPPGVLGRPDAVRRSASTIPALQDADRDDYQQEQFGQAAAAERATTCRSASPTCRRRRSSASSGRSRATPCASRYEVAPKIGDTLDRQTVDVGRAVLPAHRRVGTAGAARPRLQELGRRRPTSSTSAATPRCAATSTCSSSAASRRSSTPSCASR